MMQGSKLAISMKLPELKLILRNLNSGSLFFHLLLDSQTKVIIMTLIVDMHTDKDLVPSNLIIRLLIIQIKI
jgi:hypothetical protein